MRWISKRGSASQFTGNVSNIIIQINTFYFTSAVHDASPGVRLCKTTYSYSCNMFIDCS